MVKAAHCYGLAKQFDMLIKLCNEHNIKLNQSLLEELASTKTDPEILKRFAAICEQQGVFQIAVNLFSGLRDYVSALKCLIRMGNSRKVVTYAQKCKKRETYILAGNYLLTCNPHEDESVFKTIIDFYTKAQANDKIILFYESLAKSVIQEHQQYDKAIDYLKQGLQITESTNGIQKKDVIQNHFIQCIEFIKKYQEASSCANSDPKKAIQISLELLKTNGVDEILRVDDLYIIMVQSYVTQQNWPKAHGILEELKSNNVDLNWYFDLESLKKIYKMAGAVFDEKQKEEVNDLEIVDDDIMEEINSDIDI